MHFCLCGLNKQDNKARQANSHVSTLYATLNEQEWNWYPCSHLTLGKRVNISQNDYSFNLKVNLRLKLVMTLGRIPSKQELLLVLIWATLTSWGSPMLLGFILCGTWTSALNFMVMTQQQMRYFTLDQKYWTDWHHHSSKCILYY